MKRFVATETWADEWYQDLPLVYKCLYKYLCDNCDNAGVWKLNKRLAEFQIGEKIDWDRVPELFGGRLYVISDGKWWLTKFIPFQYGELKETCKPHKKVIELLKSHEILEIYLRVCKGSQYPIGTVQEKEEEKDKEEEEEKEKDKGESEGEKAARQKSAEAKSGKNQEIKQAIDFLNQRCGTSFSPSTQTTVRCVSARLAEGFGVADFESVINFKADEWGKNPEMCQYLRPATLFGTKFEGYLQAAKKSMQQQGNSAKPNRQVDSVDYHAMYQKALHEEEQQNA